MSNDTTAISADTRNAILRAMVEDIGTAPQQDPHFDYWSYPGQEFWGPQSYAQSIIRKYVDLKGGGDASLALAGPMELFMQACAA